MFVDQVGMQVRAGEPMAEIYAPVLVAAQQELLASLAALEALPATATTSHRAGSTALVAAAKDKLHLLGLRAAQVEEVVQRGTVADRVTLAAEELDAMRPPFEAFFTGGLEVYRAVCPMVQGRRGYWLQPQTTITNPYHGARMYSCGEIVETLGASPNGAATGGRR